MIASRCVLRFRNGRDHRGARAVARGCPRSCAAATATPVSVPPRGRRGGRRPLDRAHLRHGTRRRGRRRCRRARRARRCGQHLRHTAAAGSAGPRRGLRRAQRDQFIGGHLDLLLGAVVCRRPADWPRTPGSAGCAPGLPDHPHHARAAGQMRWFGAVLSFEVGDADTADAVCTHVQVIALATSLGGVKSTSERVPRITTRRG